MGFQATIGLQEMQAERDQCLSRAAHHQQTIDTLRADVVAQVLCEHQRRVIAPLFRLVF